MVLPYVAIGLVVCVATVRKGHNPFVGVMAAFGVFLIGRCLGDMLGEPAILRILQ